MESLFRAALEHVGVDTERCTWDALYLRLQLPGGRDDAGSGTLGFHRDTWSSNVYAQLNWWTPIYPITAERTIAFFPAYWSRPIANTSAEWDLEEIRAQRRGARPGKKPIPIVPEPSEPVDASSELRIVIEPADLLCFSGAHAHASVPNTSGITRVSVETRTVNVDDLGRDRGAPKVDGRAPRVAIDWFRRISDGEPLPVLLRARA